jgi:hypothetical protein
MCQYRLQQAHEGRNAHNDDWKDDVSGHCPSRLDKFGPQNQSHILIRTLRAKKTGFEIRMKAAVTGVEITIEQWAHLIPGNY